MESKRRYPRMQKMLLVSYVSALDGRQTTPVSMGRILDLNPGGLGIELFTPLPVGAALEMEIDLDGVLISASGSVVHSREEGEGRWVVGIRFSNPDSRFAIGTDA